MDILYLNAKDIEQIALTDAEIIGAIEDSLRAQGNGQTSIRRLYALGEPSCTGLHGANRLASNSLIEAVVYADRAARHTAGLIGRTEFQEGIPDWDFEGTQHTEEMLMIIQSKREMQQIMTNYVGIVRSNLSLKRAMRRLEILYEETEELYNKTKPNRELCELRNMISVAYLVIKQGRELKESVGCHFNTDYPQTDAPEPDAAAGTASGTDARPAPLRAHRGRYRRGRSAPARTEDTEETPAGILLRSDTRATAPAPHDAEPLTPPESRRPRGRPHKQTTRQIQIQ